MGWLDEVPDITTLAMADGKMKIQFMRTVGSGCGSSVQPILKFVNKECIPEQYVSDQRG